ncbi:MAG TPA: hopanoid-associated sugar epimerase [Methylovirgula sp.]|nr:hopanoid-associated sugar epimerase [Methylovirgula sp.]
MVTGASGFVGSAVALALATTGFKVRALVRPTSPRLNLKGLDVEIAEGDMRDRESVARALCGARYLMHVAADYRLWAPDPAEILVSNREGTRTIMHAALKAGIERIVYTSSVATLAVTTNGECIDETKPLSGEKAIGTYKKSKVAAEEVVARMIAEEHLPAVIVHPSTPIGPRDVKPTPTGRIIIEAACGRMPGYVDTGLNLVHVDDVAAGHIAALKHGRIGEHYILGGQNVGFAAMLADIAALSGRRPPRLCVPRNLLYPLAFVAEARARRTGREPFLTRDGLAMSKYQMFFTSAKAERDLGYRARPYREGLADALAWFRQHGYVG